MKEEHNSSRVILGEIIRIMRSEQDLSQDDLYSMSDVTKNSISNIEQGRTDTHIATLDALSKALDTTTWSLLSCRDQALRAHEDVGVSPIDAARRSAPPLPFEGDSVEPSPVIRALGRYTTGLLAEAEGPEGALHAVPSDPSDPEAMIPWVADGLLAGYRFDIVAMIGSNGTLYPLPTESASMANMLERTLVEHLGAVAESVEGVQAELPRSDRIYPDIAFTGPALGGQVVACDIKVARRDPGNRERTKSKITLYTGNTYFRDPEHNTQNIMRPFNEYALHLDCVALYDFVTEPHPAVTNVELIVVEPWRIGSHTRSSGTRNYIGAIQSVPKIEAGIGEFATKEEFYSYWRSYEGWS